MIWFLGNLHSVGGKDSRPPTTSHTQDSEYLENYDDNAREDESDDDAGVLSQVYPPPLLTHSGAYIRAQVHPWKVGVIVPRGPLEVAEPMKN